jgi:hypothetical protein
MDANSSKATRNSKVYSNSKGFSTEWTPRTSDPLEIQFASIGKHSDCIGTQAAE